MYKKHTCTHWSDKTKRATLSTHPHTKFCRENSAARILYQKHGCLSLQYHSVSDPDYNK